MNPFENAPSKLSSSMSIREFAYLCLAKWKWFALSLAVFLTLAVAYLLRTPNTYTRNASVLIKEESRGKGINSDVASQLSSMGLFTANSNVYNEVINFQSPDLMYEVVKRLKLNVTYQKDGTFHKVDLYGTTLPVNVEFKSLGNNDDATLTIVPKGKDQVLLKDFTYMGGSLDGEVTVKIGDKVKTPLGFLRVVRSADKQTSDFDFPIYVTRRGFNATTENCGRRMIVAVQDKNATVIDLSYKDVNVQRAQEVINTLINVYNESWISDRNRISVSTNEFISERLKVIESDLGNVDNLISNYKSSTMSPDLAASAQMDMQQSAEATKELMNLNNQLGVSRYLLNHIKSHPNQLMPANAGLEEVNTQTLINEYNQSLLQRNRLVESSSEENLLVQDLDKQLEQMRNAVMTSINNYIASLNMRVSSSQAMRSGANARISANPRQAGKLLSDERQQKVKEALYLFLLQKREENELSQAFTSYNTRVIVTPEHGGSLRPTSPKKRVILLVALLLGLLLPAVLIYIKEGFETKVRGRVDLKNMSAPLLGEIPQGKYSHRSALQKLFGSKRKKKDEKRRVVVKANSRNMVNEAFRVVRTNVEFMKPDSQKGFVIMTTSANPGSGKTFISANLGAAIGLRGKKVLVIDLDLRLGALSGIIDNPESGLSDYLAGHTKDYRSLICSIKEIPDLDFLPVGTIPPNPSELLMRQELADMIEDLKNDYDYIIFDCPPVEIVTDSDIINKYADATIFVVRAGLMERSMLSVIDEYYTSGKYKNLMILLNGTDGGGHYGYKYGYKYGYHYGYRSSDSAYGGYDSKDE